MLVLTLVGVCSVQRDLASSDAAFASGSKGPKTVGSIDDILEDTVLLRGSILTRTGAPLYPGDVLNTKKGGSVVFKLRMRHAVCTLDRGGVLRRQTVQVRSLETASRTSVVLPRAPAGKSDPRAARATGKTRCPGSRRASRPARPP